MSQEQIEAIREIVERPFRGNGLSTKVEEAMNLSGLGFTTVEIARIEGVTLDAIKQRLATGNKALETKKKELTQKVFQQIKEVLDK